ncbi:unnamed protein product [Polarella glacialis]|uniref:Uncharacterized protein n=1 Tax=Polarella glacialis TaxID=89957 RepID=A0A813JKP4_POLGL|nr:unnamed protein product [Polarella glacialis]
MNMELPDSWKGLSDEQLKAELKRRHRISEGEKESLCYVKEGKSKLDGSGDSSEELLGEERPSATSSAAPFRRRARAVKGDGLHTPRGRTRGAGLPSGGSSSRLNTSPHFSLETPPGSRSPSPVNSRDAGSGSNSGSRGVNRGTPQTGSSHPGADATLDEWQFEILNNLPRDTALALVDHIKASDRQRQEAARLATELSQTNSELQKRLRDKGRDTGGRRYFGLTGFFFCCCVLLVSLGLGMALGGIQAVTMRRHAVKGLDLVRSLISSGVDVHRITEADAGGLSVSAGSFGSDFGGQSSDKEFRGRQEHQDLVLIDGKVVRETTVREVMMRQTTTREYDPSEIETMQAENLQMKLQLERLWLDIDDAVHRGQETVCWKV